jgi:hypothetical protein
VIAFIGAVYRNDVRLSAKGCTSTGYGGSKACNGQTTDKTDQGNGPGEPAAHTQRKDGIKETKKLLDRTADLLAADVDPTRLCRHRHSHAPLPSRLVSFSD